MIDSKLTNLRTLIVDEENAGQLRNQLEALGYVVIQVHSKDALEHHLRDFPEYDVILMERHLPSSEGGSLQQTGVDLYKMLNQRYPHAEIRLYTSDDSELLEMGENDGLQLINKEQEMQKIIQDVIKANRYRIQASANYYKSVTELIGEISHTLLSNTSEENIIFTILNGISKIGFDRVRLALWNQQDSQWVIRGQVGHGNNFDRRSNEWIPVCEFDLENPVPCLINESDEITHLYYKKPSSRIRGVQQRVEIPLVNQGELIGAIATDTVISGRQILQEEMEPLKVIAKQGAVALSKISLTKRDEAQTAQRQQLVEAVLKISQLKLTDDIYQAVSKTILDLFPNVEHSGLIVFEHEYRSGIVKSEYPNYGIIGTIIPIRGIMFEERLLDIDTPYIQAYDVTQEKGIGEVGEVLHGLGIKSILIVPIRYEGHLIGSFSLDVLTKHHKFTPENIEMSQILAAHVGAALINAQHRTRLDILDEIAEQLGGEIKREKHLAFIVERATKLLNAMSGGIALLNKDRQGLEVIYDSHRTPKLNSFLKYGEGMAGYLFKHKKKYLHTPDYNSEPYSAKIFEESEPFGAVIMVPLSWHEEPIGVLYIDDEKGRKFTDSDIVDLQRFASFVTNVINLTSLLKERTQLVNALATLNIVGDSIESADNIERISHFALNGLTASYALSLDMAALFVFDPPENPKHLIGVAAVGSLTAEDHFADTFHYIENKIEDYASYLIYYEKEGFLETSLHKQIKGMKAVVSEPVTNELVEWVHNFSNDAIRLPERLVKEVDLQQLPHKLQPLFHELSPLWVVALLAEKNLIGLFFVQNPWSQRLIKIDHQQALGTFATSTAIAIDRVRLTEKLGKERERLVAERKLVQQAAEIVALVKPEETVQNIILESRKVLEAECVRLYLFDKWRAHEAATCWESSGEEVTLCEISDEQKFNLRTLSSITEIHYKPAHEEFPYQNLVPNSNHEIAAFVAPLIFENRPYGVLCATYDEETMFSGFRRDAITRLRNFCSATLYNLNRLQSADRGVIRLDTLREINSYVSVEFDQENFLNFIVKKIVSALDKQQKTPLFCDVRLREGDILSVKTVESKISSLKPEDAVNSWHTLLSQGESSYGITGRAFNTRKTIYIPNVENDELYRKTVQGVRSEIAVPILWHDKHCLGVLNIEHGEIDPFSQDDIKWLEAIATQLAFDIVQLRVKKQQEAFHIVSKKFASAITQKQAMPNLLGHIYEALRPMSGAKISQVLLHEVSENIMELKHTYPHPLRIQKIDLSSPNGRVSIAGQCALTGESLLVGNVKQDPNYIPLYPETYSKLAVPMVYDKKVVAVLSLHSDVPDAFMEEDKVLVETFAELASIVRHNGHQFHAMADLRQRVEGNAALATIGAISTVYEHSNRNRAVTIRDRILLLKQDIKNPQLAKEHLDVIQSAVESILEFRIRARLDDIESGDHFAFNELLNSYFAKHDQSKILGSVQLVLDCEDCTLARVRGHREWFFHLFDLIFRNTKYALRNVVNPLLTITARINQAEKKLVVTFTDNGLGFPENILPLLGIRQIPKSQKERGSGIGLAIGRLIVESYGGKIFFGNCNPNGAQIIVELPTEPN